MMSKLDVILLFEDIFSLQITNYGIVGDKIFQFDHLTSFYL